MKSKTKLKIALAVIGAIGIALMFCHTNGIVGKWVLIPPAVIVGGLAGMLQKVELY